MPACAILQAGGLQPGVRPHPAGTAERDPGWGPQRCRVRFKFERSVEEALKRTPVAFLT